MYILLKKTKKNGHVADDYRVGNRIAAVLNKYYVTTLKFIITFFKIHLFDCNSIY